MKHTKFAYFLFPILIAGLGLIIYKVLKFQPNFYTIMANIGLAYMLSLSLRIIDPQSK